ncbi:MAG: TraM recognition domain-containing protein, partial [Lamprobacter sp.]|uniref:TraM recognition domain-containing protein n=1 Tax=Lamprobacter sp. TaxID=3100796 RepID=UPI002B2566F1
PLLKSSRMQSSNIFINHIVSITSPIMDIAAQEYFNIGQINLAHELRKGKIVIIHTDGIPANILAILTSTLLESLALEIGKDTFSNLHPVSVFIDEAQRVVSPNLDLGVDVLREAKVELFLSFQNINLLISTLGENETMALLKNLTSVFRFSNLESGSSKLQTFEYIKGHDSFQAKPFKAD